jgi:DNA invertase Pin-like site-specific DNA recombinase
MEKTTISAGTPTAQEKWRAALYLRISKEDGDKEESESVTNQRALCLSHLGKTPDVTVVSEALDDGWSGATFQRPRFQEMMSDIRAGKINCVCVKDANCK